MTRKIFRSIWLVALAVLLAGITLATGFLYRYFNETQVRQLKAELALVADTVNDIGVEYFEHFDSTVFRFTVTDDRGQVLYDTQADTAKMENHSDREEILEALSTGTGSSARRSATVLEKTYYEAVRLKNGDVLRISASQTTVGALLIQMLPAICIIILVTAALAFLLSHRMARRITDPLRQLDLEQPPEEDTYEELRPILQRLRKQRRQISQQMESLRRKSEEFEQLVSAMSEGLVLLDEQAMILSMNASAKGIFGVTGTARGRDFWGLELSEKMRRAVWKALDGTPKEWTEERQGNEYRFHINPVRAEGKPLGALLLAVEITDRALAERSRREFTANVSHELKTPLQSILGSAELLAGGLVKPEDQGRFISNIQKEARGLVSLINDIIRLSQLDEGQEPATEGVDVYRLAQEVLGALEDSAAAKKVTMTIEGSSCTVPGVSRYIYEILYNLCDNAIRYNVEGGRVQLQVGKEDGKAVITVSDTGIGIAPEHLPRIFERFYRVDQSHSKETGGTGLGLSIVKHAVQHHGGEIGIDSEPGKGTRIRVVF